FFEHVIAAEQKLAEGGTDGRPVQGGEVVPHFFQNGRFRIEGLLFLIVIIEIHSRPVTDSAGQGREKAGDGLQEGGFAGAVGADQGDPLPPFNPEGETGGQRGGRIVSDRQFPGFQHVLSAGGGDVKTDGRGRAFFGRAFDGLHSL